MGIVIRDMGPEDVYYVSTCSHVRESDEIDRSGERRRAWLSDNYARGLRAIVAELDGRRVGFAYVMPIEVCPWGPLGHNLAVLPCLYVQQPGTGHGVGSALIEAAEREAKAQGRAALVIPALYADFWFMPAPFFGRLGYTVAERKGPNALLWKPFTPDAPPPRRMEPRYRYEPAPGKVVIDLFWHTFCGTSDIEAERVRAVAAEFGDQVLLREYSADDPAVRARYGIPRAIYIDGEEIGWGYEAPKEGIREAIARRLSP